MDKAAAKTLLNDLAEDRITPAEAKRQLNELALGRATPMDDAPTKRVAVGEQLEDVASTAVEQPEERIDWSDLSKRAHEAIKQGERARQL